MANRIWIELEYPETKEIGDERAKLVSNLINRLTQEDKRTETPVFWHDKKKHYCFTTNMAGGYVEAGDNGHWYSLDYFGRELNIS